jgi:hypothetical protein
MQLFTQPNNTRNTTNDLMFHENSSPVSLNKTAATMPIAFVA